MTDQEINEEVAWKLGLEPLGDRWHRPNVNDRNCCDYLPDYCHSIAAAWEIIDYRPDVTWLLCKDHRDGKYWIRLHSEENEQYAPAVSADTAPMAICLAFLKLEGPKLRRVELHDGC